MAARLNARARIDIDSAEGRGESRHDLTDLFLGHDERRREHNEIAVLSVGVPCIRPDDQSSVEGRPSEPLGETSRAWEGLSRLDIGDEFDAREQPPPSYIADVRETAESLDLNATTVRTRLFRAQRQLRGDLTRRLREESSDIFNFGAERCDRVVASVLSRLPA